MYPRFLGYPPYGGPVSPQFNPDNPEPPLAFYSAMNEGGANPTYGTYTGDNGDDTVSNSNDMYYGNGREDYGTYPSPGRYYTMASGNGNGSYTGRGSSGVWTPPNWGGSGWQPQPYPYPSPQQPRYWQQYQQLKAQGQKPNMKFRDWRTQQQQTGNLSGREGGGY